MSVWNTKINLVFFVLICTIYAQCPLGEAINSEGVCEPCMISNCAYCANSDTLTCQACVQPYSLGPDGQTCVCPTGYGSIDKGGCIVCSVPNCAVCSIPGKNMCEQCMDNFSNKQTDSGIQCVCEYPFILSEQGECVCPPGQGLNSNGGCSACSVSNCEVCSASGDSTCQKCFGSAQLTADGSACTCPLGQGPALNIGCAPCRPEHCASCSNALFNRCETCLPNFKKMASQTRTICVCEAPFQMRADGSCECPATQGPNGSGGCGSCSVDNCDSCEGSNFQKCSICTPPYVVNENGACQCPSGYYSALGGGCTKCQVQHCLSCNDPQQNSCAQCQENFVNIVTGNSSQCLCKAPFFVDAEGVCGCPEGTAQYGNQCIACQVSKCASCSSPNSTVCSQCAPTYVLTSNGASCECPSGMAPLNGYSCAPCADSNCESCQNSAIDVCSTCLGNFTLRVKEYNNVTSQVESNECVCNKPFVVDEEGNCLCPLGKTFALGTCVKCAVANCQNCGDSNSLCSSCFEPFVLNDQGNQCVCKEGYTLDNGLCVPCQVSNCAVCSASSDNCEECFNNFLLTSKNYTEFDQSENKSITMETATCMCTSPFVLNTQGLCVCPMGMFNDMNGGCVSCSVDNCDYCSSVNQCQACSESFILTSNSQCACPSGQATNKDGFCEDCALSNCAVCSSSDSLKCQFCQTNFTLVTTQANGIQNQECQCVSPYTITLQGYCMLICPPGTVQVNNTCQKCHIYQCSTCSPANVYSCNTCKSPFVLAEDGKQCVCPVGKGPYKNTCEPCSDNRCAMCPVNLGACYSCKPPFELNSEGQCDCPRGSGVDRYGICSSCLVQNCGQCESSYAPTCVSCIYPSTLNADKSQCICPPGQAVMPNGGCSLCAVLNCEDCPNSVERTCTKCKPSFVLDEESHECRCPLSQGPNRYGVCETCQLKDCIECHKSSFTCSVCQAPFITNNDGTACICPLGQAPNAQGGCASCQVDHCKTCPTSNEFYCDECFPAFQLGKNGTKCYWPDQNMDGCPLGHGLNADQECEFCQIRNCIKCYSDLSTCSICEAPFLPNSNGSECVCPRGQAPNAQGGCAYCQVPGCEVCTTSLLGTCKQCYAPLQLEGNQCKIPKQKKSLFGKIVGGIGGDIVNDITGDSDSSGAGTGVMGRVASGIANYYSFTDYDYQDEMADHLALGFLTGFLIFIVVLGVGAMIYNFFYKKNKSNSTYSEEARSFQVQLPRTQNKVA